MYRWAVPRALARRLARVRERTGMPVARQLRRAAAEYLDQHEVAGAPPAPRPTPVPTPRGGSER